MSGPNAENQLTRLALLERRQKRQAQSMRYAAGIAGGALVAIAGLAGYAFQTFTGNGPELPHHVHRHVLRTLAAPRPRRRRLQLLQQRLHHRPRHGLVPSLASQAQPPHATNDEISLSI